MFKMLQKDPTQFAESAITSLELEEGRQLDRSQDHSIQENQSDEFSEQVRPDSSDEEPDHT